MRRKRWWIFLRKPRPETEAELIERLAEEEQQRQQSRWEVPALPMSEAYKRHMERVRGEQ